MSLPVAGAFKDKLMTRYVLSSSSVDVVYYCCPGYRDACQRHRHEGFTFAPWLASTSHSPLVNVTSSLTRHLKSPVIEKISRAAHRLNNLHIKLHENNLPMNQMIIFQIDQVVNVN